MKSSRARNLRILISAKSPLIDTELYILEGKEEGLWQGTLRSEDHIWLGCVPNQPKRDDFPVISAQSANKSHTSSGPSDYSRGQSEAHRELTLRNEY